jgi:guanylate kinase
MAAVERGGLFVIAAPSGAGKTTLFKMALESFDNLVPSVSCTTRPKRDNEVEGEDYFFIPDEKFEYMIRENKFIEWAVVHNYKYGTPCEFIEDCIKNGKDVLFDIDVQGAENLKKIFPDSVLTFILPPSFEVLKDRLVNRMTDMSDDIEVRMKNAVDEIKGVKGFDYLIFNDSLKEAFEELKSIIVAARAKKKKDTFNFDEFIKI